MAAEPLASPPPMIGPFTVQPGDLAAPFWEGVAAHELRLQRCDTCDRWIWGPQWRCGWCGTWDPVWTPVDARGTVFSWIRTWHVLAPAVAASVPYVTLLVEVPGTDGCRLLGLWADGSDPVIGAEVEVVWPDTSAGDDRKWSLWWRPVDDHEGAR